MEETTTAITAVKEEVRLRDWAAQIEAQQANEHVSCGGMAVRNNHVQRMDVFMMQ